MKVEQIIKIASGYVRIYAVDHRCTYSDWHAMTCGECELDSLNRKLWFGRVEDVYYEGEVKNCPIQLADSKIKHISTTYSDGKRKRDRKIMLNIEI